MEDRIVETKQDNQNELLAYDFDYAPSLLRNMQPRHTALPTVHHTNIIEIALTMAGISFEFGSG